MKWVCSPRWLLAASDWMCSGTPNSGAELWILFLWRSIIWRIQVTDASLNIRLLLSSMLYQLRKTIVLWGSQTSKRLPSLVCRRRTSRLRTRGKGSTHKWFVNVVTIQHEVRLIFIPDSIMFKTHADMKSWAQPEPYAAWVDVLAIQRTDLIQGTLLVGKRVKQLGMKPLLPKICAAFSSNIFTRAMIRKWFLC
jgi:hypothetical protein